MQELVPPSVSRAQGVPYNDGVRKSPREEVPLLGMLGHLRIELKIMHNS